MSTRPRRRDLLLLDADDWRHDTLAVAGHPNVTPPHLDEHATIRSVDFIPASEALVSADAKYIYWPDFDYEELFDLQQDPREERNLAGEPGIGARLEPLRARFAALKAEAK